MNQDWFNLATLVAILGPAIFFSNKIYRSYLCPKVLDEIGENDWKNWEAVQAALKARGLRAGKGLLIKILVELNVDGDIAGRANGKGDMEYRRTPVKD